jgi:hypothetical protein
MLHARAAPREIRVAGSVVAEGGRVFDFKPAAHWLMGGKVYTKAWGWAAACDRRGRQNWKKVQESSRNTRRAVVFSQFILYHNKNSSDFFPGNR